MLEKISRQGQLEGCHRMFAATRLICRLESVGSRPLCIKQAHLCCDCRAVQITTGCAPAGVAITAVAPRTRVGHNVHNLKQADLECLDVDLHPRLHACAWLSNISTL